MGFSAKRFGKNTSLDTMMKAAQTANASHIIDLALGDPDLDTDPRIIEATFEDARQGYTHYSSARGDSDLLAALRASWASDLGISVAEEEIMVTTSGCHAMWLLLSAILDPSDEVIIFSPYFSPYPEQIRLAGGVPIEVATHAHEGFAPSPSAVAHALSSHTKALIINSPCNPTGVILSQEQINELLSLCIEHDILLIADDIYTSYDFQRPFVAAASLPFAHGHVATIHSFSKDFCMSGWRLGYVVAPEEVISTMLSVNESNVYVAPTLSQRAAYHALHLRHEISASIHTTYGERMHYAAQRIAAIPYLDLPASAGSLYAFIDISKTGETSESFTQELLEKYQVSVIPGSAFGSAGEGFVRMALRKSIPTLQQIFDALSKDEQWLNQVK